MFSLPKFDSEVAALFFITFIVGSSVSMLAPLLPEIKQEFGLSYTAAALVFSSYGIARLFLSLPAGYVYNRVNRKLLLASGLLLMLASSLMAFRASSFAEFIASQVVMGAGFSFCVTTVIISLSGLSTKSNRGKVMGSNTFARSAAATVAPAAAGFITLSLGWRAVYLFYVIALGAALVVMHRYAKRQITAREEREHGGKGGNTGMLLVLFVVTFLATFSTAGFKSNVVPLYGSDVLRLDTATISMVLSLMAFMHLVTSPIAAWYSDKYGRRIFLLIGLAATALGSFALLFAADVALLIAAAALLGVGTMIFVTPPIIMGDITPHRQAGRNYGILRFTQDLGFVVGPVLLGYTVDTYGFGAAALLTGFLSLFVFVLAYVVVKEPETHAKLNWKRILQIEAED
ncbi:MAG: MFS transporter [Candidatus Aenigmarchaeota archaeon]|nr:MFS transporter [Candidatus Aenigmarchaeota archaeon]